MTTTTIAEVEAAERMMAALIEPLPEPLAIADLALNDEVFRVDALASAPHLHLIRIPRGVQCSNRSNDASSAAPTKCGW